jgi:hypothetical protein
MYLQCSLSLCLFNDHCIYVFSINNLSIHHNIFLFNGHYIYAFSMPYCFIIVCAFSMTIVFRYFQYLIVSSEYIPF